MNALAKAIAAVDMSHFVTEPDGRPLPQSSAPAIIAALIRLAEVQPGDRVLEIGTGSGYSTALLATIVGHEGVVVSVEVDQAVADRATGKLADTPQATVICGDGGQGAPESAPFDRVIAWATPAAIPEPWVRQVRDGGIIVTPVKVAPVALANLTIKLIVTDAQPVVVALHEGSFVDMTATAADHRVPSAYVDATAATGGEVPAWLSAPAVRDAAAAATALLAGLANNPQTDNRPTPSFVVLTAALAAARPEQLATVFTGSTRGIGYATHEGIAVATPDGILSYGHTDPLDMLTADLRVLDASLTTCTAAVESTADGWTVRLVR